MHTFYLHVVSQFILACGQLGVCQGEREEARTSVTKSKLDLQLEDISQAQRNDEGESV